MASFSKQISKSSQSSSQGIKYALIGVGVAALSFAGYILLKRVSATSQAEPKKSKKKAVPLVEESTIKVEEEEPSEQILKRLDSDLDHLMTPNTKKRSIFEDLKDDGVVPEEWELFENKALKLKMKCHPSFKVMQISGVEDDFPMIALGAGQNGGLLLTVIPTKVSAADMKNIIVENGRPYGLTITVSKEDKLKLESGATAHLFVSELKDQPQVSFVSGFIPYKRRTLYFSGQHTDEKYIALKKMISSIQTEEYLYRGTLSLNIEEEKISMALPSVNYSLQKIKKSENRDELFHAYLAVDGENKITNGIRLFRNELEDTFEAYLEKRKQDSDTIGEIKEDADLEIDGITAKRIYFQKKIKNENTSMVEVLFVKDKNVFVVQVYTKPEYEKRFMPKALKSLSTLKFNDDSVVEDKLLYNDKKFGYSVSLPTYVAHLKESLIYERLLLTVVGKEGNNKFEATIQATKPNTQINDMEALEKFVTDELSHTLQSNQMPEIKLVESSRVKNANGQELFKCLLKQTIPPNQYIPSGVSFSIFTHLLMKDGRIFTCLTPEVSESDYSLIKDSIEKLHTSVTLSAENRA